MKRSGNVSLAVMGTAAFAMTFAGGMTYLNWSRPSHAATPQTAASSTCTPRPDGTCEPARRGFSYYLVPSFFHGSSPSSTTPAKPVQSAALTSKPRATTPAVSPSGTTRGGFGTTARSSSFRTSSAGG
jgi:hypothetical protein